MLKIKFSNSNDLIFDFLLKLLKDKKTNEKKVSHFNKGKCHFEVTLPCRDCHNDIRLNLAGLTDNLNFKLLSLEDRKVEVDTSCTKEKGIIEDVGIDYIELKNKRKKNVIILKDKIDHIHLLDKDKKLEEKSES